MADDKTEDVECSFCGISLSDAFMGMAAGPNVHICGVCIEMSADAVHAKRKDWYINASWRLADLNKRMKKLEGVKEPEDEASASDLFTPVIPEAWEHYVGLASIDISDDEAIMRDEDIWSARWKGWNIWIDGGKGISIWQCGLVEPGYLGPDGQLVSDHSYLMRDFLNTPKEVQSWIDRAVVAAEKYEEDNERRECEEEAVTT